MTTTRLSLMVLLAGALVAGPACSKKDKSEKKSDGDDKGMIARKAPERPVSMKRVEPPLAMRPMVARPMLPEPMAARPMAADPMATPAMTPDPMAARPAATPPVVLNVPKGAGPIYFGTKDNGLVALDGAKFTSAFKKKKWVKAVARAADGTLYIAAIGGVFRVKRGKARKIGGYRNVGSPDAIAIDAKGGLWTASYKGVGHWNGKKWTVDKKELLGGDAKLLKGLAVDAKGRVLVASSNALHVKENNAWKTLDLSTVFSARTFFKRVSLSPSGAIYAVGSKGLLKYDNGTLSKVPVSSRYLYDMAMGNDGRIYLRDLYKVYVLDAAGKELRSFKVSSLGVKAKRVDQMAGDASGRLWLTTDHGVVIVDKAGKAVQWEPGVFPKIAGQISVILPVAAGPAALPVPGKKVVGDVRGKVVRGGRPVANALIEICASPSSYYRGSPCAKATWKLVSKTDGKGGFLFKSVPLGNYGFAVKGGPKWSTLSKYFSKCCTKLKPGKVLNIGKLKLRAPKITKRKK